MIEAVKSGDAARLKRLVDDTPEAVSARDEEGTSALLHAVYRDRLDLAQILLDAGASVDVFEAAALGRADLLAKEIGRDPTVVAAWSHDGFTLLHLAAFFGHEDAVSLLLDRDAEVGTVSRNAMGVTPLHSAVAGDHAAVARLLVERGADVNASQQGGWTPLHSAAANGNADLVDYLLAKGAERDAVQDEGRTAADLAGEKGHAELERSLRG